MDPPTAMTSERRPRPILRGAIALSIGSLAWLMLYVAFDLLWRVIPGAGVSWVRYLTLSAATASAVITIVGAWRKLPASPARAWFLLPLVGLPTSFIGLLVESFAIHLEFGTPAMRCHWSHVTVDECVGRDWSFMQDRQSFVFMRGTIDPARCRSFASRGAVGSRSPVGADGRVRCSADRPEVWAPRPCDEFDLAEAAKCSVCEETSETMDQHVYVMGFDDSCERVVVFEGVNVSPTNLDACRQAIRSRECP